MLTYALLGAVFISCCLQEYSCNADKDTSPWRKVKTRQKRQVQEDLCKLPGEELAHGRYWAHPRRCPADDNSAACRRKHNFWVNTGWVLLYECHLGYRLDTFLTRRASICHRQDGGAQWIPSLPRCIESFYDSSILPSKQICGKPAQNTQTERNTRPNVDGVISQRGSWPWMVIFGQHKTKANGARDGIHWFCAGTLVTKRHVLTAADCVHNYRNRPLTYVARLDDLNLADDSDGGEAIEILIERTDVRVHPGFNENMYFADNIAIVRLKRELKITDFIRPICLPTPDFADRSFSGETAYVASWGQEDRIQKRWFQPILHEVKGKVVNHDVCKTNYTNFQQSDTPFIISDGIICATLDIRKNCQGDVGSPLMMKSKGNYILLGIVATKFLCGDENYPRLFTKVSTYMDWIVRNLQF